MISKTDFFNLVVQAQKIYRFPSHKRNNMTYNMTWLMTWLRIWLKKYKYILYVYMSGYGILTGTLFMYMNCVDATWDKICTEITNLLENRIST